MLKSCFAFALLAFPAIAAPPTLRLPENVRPLHYNLDLTLIPEQDTFTGHVEIDLDIRQPTDVIWLNARKLILDEAKIVVGGRTEAAKIQPGGKEFAGFALAGAIQSGKATLEIAYRGELNKKSSGGLFKQQEGGDWYIYSQFEAIDAR